MMTTLGLSLSGCGLFQSVSESTASVSRAIFHKQVRTLHLDLSARAGMNLDAADMNALSVPTLVRVYQLRDDKTVQRTDYDNVTRQGAVRLRSDVLDEHAVVIRPEEGVQISRPLHPQAQFVAVVGLFREPDRQDNSWRLVLTRDELDPERARVIELQDNRLDLRPLGEG
ncbi:type VI secretion system lipoprotein TssJ [Pseudomonas sp. Leaf127]|uniref:type VI secretion system lipoprotein TssJ n=1 Tax=Pseudomonas sp. Leaf127 TaxID=1736267 RepID=UPI0009EA80DB|nr:type VI secretion system lipoprotein TssJ [Pseudomonas sp. Leaf127]